MAGMTTEELRAFLERTRPALLGVVATLRADGFPHLVPVWYRFDGQAIHVWTHEERAWVRHLKRDRRVAFSAQEEQPPYAAATMHGYAAIATGDGEVISAEIRRITERYVDAADVEAYIRQWIDLRTIVTITPLKIASWVVES